MKNRIKNQVFNPIFHDFSLVLASGGFTGKVWAVHEGTTVFSHEPLLPTEVPFWQV
jgi:nicotinic acid phosphoribosyltransferase